MDTLDKRKKLVDEAISLIREFEGISVDIRETRIEELSLDDEYTKISYELEGEKLEFPLTQISHIYEIEFEGLGELSPTFPELVSAVKQNIENNFNEMSKDDFIHFVGNIYYADLRCREIYKRLKEIEIKAAAI
ncbi:MAG: hypothetical protein ACRCTZ_06795 [Sarcina sp.]